MREFIHAQIARLFTRRCRCPHNSGYHTHHLTWIGRLHYFGRIRTGR